MKGLIVVICLFFVTSATDKTRTINYNGKDVLTTYEVPQKFYGTYTGAKTGYLELNEDGTGTYEYDVFGFAPSSCKKQAIPIIWGFLLDENNEIVSFEREYGLSFPILMQSTGETQFQGCRTPVMLDFIMQYDTGQLGISSSDDWVKD